jgi:hypothetical protein
MDVTNKKGFHDVSASWPDAAQAVLTDKIVEGMQRPAWKSNRSEYHNHGT